MIIEDNYFSNAYSTSHFLRMILNHCNFLFLIKMFLIFVLLVVWVRHTDYTPLTHTQYTHILLNLFSMIFGVPHQIPPLWDIITISLLLMLFPDSPGFIC